MLNVQNLFLIHNFIEVDTVTLLAAPVLTYEDVFLDI